MGCSRSTPSGLLPRACSYSSSPPSFTFRLTPSSLRQWQGFMRLGPLCVLCAPHAPPSWLSSHCPLCLPMPLPGQLPPG